MIMPINFLSDEDMNAFVEAAREVEGERGLILRMLLKTGARVPELVNLEVEDFALADEYLTIRDPKSRSSRKLPLADPVLTELRDHIGEKDSGLVFEDLVREGPAAHRLYWLVRQTAKKAGIERRVGPHEIRHTVGARLAKSGASAEEVAAILGHTPNRDSLRQVLVEATRF